ncbi:MAG: NYN domain-containing protein [Halobacteriales archaeon]
MTQRTAMMFVDAQNLFHGAKSYDDSFQYDFEALRDELMDGYYTVRSYWFDSYKDKSSKQGFFDQLRMSGYRVTTVPLRRRGDGHVEKGVDIQLATELIAQAYNGAYDVAILVSGDADYARAVRYVQDQGKRVVVASFEETTSSEMRKLADEYVELDSIASAIEFEG